MRQISQQKKSMIGQFMKIVISATVILLVTGAAYSDRATSANKLGIKAYQEQDFEASAQHFTEATVERPESPELKFNRGTALSALNKTDEALKDLNSAAGMFKDGNQSAAALYNAGNTLATTQNLEAAIETYKRAIMLDNASEDIKYNLELAVRRLNQQKQEQEQENSEDKEKKEDGEEENQQDQQKREEEKEEEEKGQSETENDPQDGEKSDDDQQQSQQQDNEEVPMTDEEAQRLLDAINDEEKKALSTRYMQMKSTMRPGDDW
ncbi:tetratricopeptide repeat protein [Candidatus Latescibacterota bacterium]